MILTSRAVGVAPPIITRPRGEHGDGAPDGHPRAEWCARAKDVDGKIAIFFFGEKGVADGEPAGDESREGAAEVNRHVRGSPECVAANAFVPGDIPRDADGDAGEGKRHQEARPKIGVAGGANVFVRSRHADRCLHRNRVRAFGGVLHDYCFIASAEEGVEREIFWKVEGRMKNAEGRRKRRTPNIER